MEFRLSGQKKAILASVGLGIGAFLGVLLLQGALFTSRGPVDVPYPAGEVERVQVLGAVDVYVDGEPRPGASVFGAIALLLLATASLVTFVALRFAGARRHLRRFWLIASAGLAVAGADELLAIHESIGHNLRFLADVPGVQRPDDLLLLLYLPGALAVAWWFRDILLEHRLTVACMAAAIACFALSAAGDLASLRAEEWFELLAGLSIAAGLLDLMHRHLKTNLQIRVGVAGPAERGAPSALGREREPALDR
jgi:hypothetical protein